MGWFKSAFGALMLAGTFYVGYTWGELDTEERLAVKPLPYKVEIHDGNYMLVKNKTKEAQPITPSLQVGTLDHRIDGILEDMKTNPVRVQQAILNSFSKHYEARK